MDILIGFIAGLTLGIGGMAMWLVPKLDDLRIELSKAESTIEFLVRERCLGHLSFKDNMKAKGLEI